MAGDFELFSQWLTEQVNRKSPRMGEALKVLAMNLTGLTFFKQDIQQWQKTHSFLLHMEYSSRSIMCWAIKQLLIYLRGLRFCYLITGLKLRFNNKEIVEKSPKYLKIKQHISKEPMGQRRNHRGNQKNCFN